MVYRVTVAFEIDSPEGTDESWLVDSIGEHVNGLLSASDASFLPSLPDPAETWSYRKLSEVRVAPVNTKPIILSLSATILLESSAATGEVQSVSILPSDSVRLHDDNGHDSTTADAAVAWARENYWAPLMGDFPEGVSWEG